MLNLDGSPDLARTRQGRFHTLLGGLSHSIDRLHTSQPPRLMMQPSPQGDRADYQSELSLEYLQLAARWSLGCAQEN